MTVETAAQTNAEIAELFTVVSQAVDVARMGNRSRGPLFTSLHQDTEDPAHNPSRLTLVYDGTTAAVDWPFAFSTPNAQHMPPTFVVQNGRSEREFDPMNISLIVQTSTPTRPEDKGMQTYVVQDRAVFRKTGVNEDGKVTLERVNKEALTVWRAASEAVRQPYKRGARRTG